MLRSSEGEKESYLLTNERGRRVWRLSNSIHAGVSLWFIPEEREREKALSAGIPSVRLVPTWQHLQGWSIEGLPDLSIRAPLPLNTGLGRVRPQERLDDRQIGFGDVPLNNTKVISHQPENVTWGVSAHMSLSFRAHQRSECVKVLFCEHTVIPCKLATQVKTSVETAYLI